MTCCDMSTVRQVLDCTYDALCMMQTTVDTQSGFQIRSDHIFQPHLADQAFENVRASKIRVSRKIVLLVRHCPQYLSRSSSHTYMHVIRERLAILISSQMMCLQNVEYHDHLLARKRLMCRSVS